MTVSQIILGIDPGYGRCGFGLIRTLCQSSGGNGSDVEVVDYGVSTTEAGVEIGARLSEVARDIEELLNRHKPDLVAIEKIFFTTNAKTAMGVAEARGAILLVCARAGVRVVELTPGQVKSAVTGNGQADKRAVEEMVMRLTDLKHSPKLDDASDALAIAITAVGLA